MKKIIIIAMSAISLNASAATYAGHVNVLAVAAEEMLVAELKAGASALDMLRDLAIETDAYYRMTEEEQLSEEMAADVAECEQY